ncbi:hypothetical protein [Streptomyces sp. NPDC087859]|uniref:hypothetical protein n=1 Tax=Streptomyces sp. NPDC087859 TaxID=3365812 RepID=UPI0037F6F08A
MGPDRRRHACAHIGDNNQRALDRPSSSGPLVPPSMSCASDSSPTSKVAGRG